MHSSSRRAFLHGRRPARTPWEQFCQRLRRTVTGEFIDYQVANTAGSGRLTAQDATDIHHVRALCSEYGVVLRLDGLAMPVRQADQPTIWVRPGKGLSRFSRLDENSNTWFVQPGCTLGALSEAGLEQFDHLPPHTTVAAWIADRTLSDYAIGRTFRSGLEHVSLRLGDGQAINLGPFSVQNTKPLDGLRLQQLVPALYRLASAPDATACLEGGFWPSRYRLDALMPVNTQTQNLAHLCLGHGGELGWIEWVVIDGDTLDPAQDQAGCFSTDLIEPQSVVDAASTLDWEIKALFDPGRVFPDSGQDL